VRLLLDARGSASLELLLAMVAVSAFVALTAPGVQALKEKFELAACASSAEWIASTAKEAVDGVAVLGAGNRREVSVWARKECNALLEVKGRELQLSVSIGGLAKKTTKALWKEGNALVGLSGECLLVVENIQESVSVSGTCSRPPLQ